MRQIITEVEQFGGDLAQRERWLVLNKKDLLIDEEFEQRRQDLLDALGWEGPVYAVSALTGEGTQELVYALMEYT